MRFLFIYLNFNGPNLQNNHPSFTNLNKYIIKERFKWKIIKLIYFHVNGPFGADEEELNDPWSEVIDIITRRWSVRPSVWLCVIVEPTAPNCIQISPIVPRWPNTGCFASFQR